MESGPVDVKASISNGWPSASDAAYFIRLGVDRDTAMLAAAKLRTLEALREDPNPVTRSFASRGINAIWAVGGTDPHGWERLRSQMMAKVLGLIAAGVHDSSLQSDATRKLRAVWGTVDALVCSPTSSWTGDARADRLAVIDPREEADHRLSSPPPARVEVADTGPPGSRITASPHLTNAPPFHLVAPRSVGELMAA